MIDINLIRKDSEAIRQRYLKKQKDIDFTQLLQWDEQRKQIIATVESMKAQRNKVSALVPQLKKQGQDVTATIAEMKKLGDEIAQLDKQLAEVSAQINDFMLRLPNLPDDDLEAGGKENNRPIKVFGEKPHFDFDRNLTSNCVSRWDLSITREAQNLLATEVGYTPEWVQDSNGHCSTTL